MKISLNPKMTRMTQFFPEGRGAGASLRLGVAGGPLVAAQKERHRRCNTKRGNRKGGASHATTTTRSTCGYYYYFCTTTWSIPRIVLLTSSTSTRSTKWYYVLLLLTAAFSPLYDSTWVLLLLMGSLIVHLCLHWSKGEWRRGRREGTLSCISIREDIWIWCWLSWQDVFLRQSFYFYF